MNHLTYEIVEHGGGWAYRADGVYSETFPNRASAHKAAERVASEQRAPGEAAVIQYETSKGEWTVENARGEDRPEVKVED